MLLAIDAGNTNVVFGVFDGDKKLCQWRAATRPDRTADEYAVLLTQWLANEGLKVSAITDVAIASVVPTILRDLRHLANRTFGHKPLVIGDDGVVLGLEVRIDRPAEAGSDRLCDAVAAHATYGGPLIVIDFGTATTFNVVDDKGNYRGGAIAPGINLSLEALHQATAKLPRIAVEQPARAIGRDTISAMQSGIYWGYIGLIEGLTRRLAKEFGGKTKIKMKMKMKVIATGGLAPLFANGTQVVDHVDTDLTLRGLVEIHRRNRSGSRKAPRKAKAKANR
ncbi:MAG: type III pantothenate kinase [Alphaproteobacteria bacterium]|nr:type III pantothenate kinase [Alphaproteobacteria bacterium]